MTVTELYNRYTAALERVNACLMRRDYDSPGLVYWERVAALYEIELVARLESRK